VISINICFICHTVKQKKKRRKKGRGLPRVPGHLALGEEEIKKKRPRAFPECLGTWHSGKAKIKKKDRAFPECHGNWHSGKSFPKKRISSPSVALGEEVKKKEISSPSVALGKE
jgi:hypothetical protein